MKQSISILFLVLVLGACGSNQKRDKSVEKNVSSKTLAVTNYPLYYFAQKIAGEEFNILFPLPQDVDPAFFEPPAEIVSKYQSAEIIFINGAGYEAWVDKVTLSQRKIVNTTKNVSDKYISEMGLSHSHGSDGEHDHTETAFTTWLDQSIALEQASRIYETLKNKYPDNSQVFDKNFQVLAVDLSELDDQISLLFTHSQGLTFYASHPVYQYLAQRYGIIIKSEHWEPGEKVESDVVKTFIESIEGDDTKIMLWEGEPHPETRQQLEDAGVKIILFIPCGNKPEQGDYLSVMKQNIKNLSLVN